MIIDSNEIFLAVDDNANIAEAMQELGEDVKLLSGLVGLEDDDKVRKLINLLADGIIRGSKKIKAQR